MTETVTDLSGFTDEQLEYLAAQPGPIKVQARAEQQRRADDSPAAAKPAKPAAKNATSRRT